MRVYLSVTVPGCSASGVSLVSVLSVSVSRCKGGSSQ